MLMSVNKTASSYRFSLFTWFLLLEFYPSCLLFGGWRWAWGWGWRVLILIANTCTEMLDYSASDSLSLGTFFFNSKVMTWKTQSPHLILPLLSTWAMPILTETQTFVVWWTSYHAAADWQLICSVNCWLHKTAFSGQSIHPQKSLGWNTIDWLINLAAMLIGCKVLV